MSWQVVSTGRRNILSRRAVAAYGVGGMALRLLLGAVKLLNQMK
jgi:hypothetical protein